MKAREIAGRSERIPGVAAVAGRTQIELTSHRLREGFGTRKVRVAVCGLLFSSKKFGQRLQIVVAQILGGERRGRGVHESRLNDNPITGLADRLLTGITTEVLHKHFRIKGLADSSIRDRST